MKRMFKVLVVLSLTVMILMNMASCKSVLDKTPYLDGPTASNEVTSDLGDQTTPEETPVVTNEPVTEPATEPEVTEPVVTEPVVTEPVVTEPVVTEPVVTEPVVTEPVVTEPVVTEPVVTEPVVTEPVVTEPVVTEPVVTEPEVTEPVVTEPVVTEPVVTEPVVTEPVVTEPEVTEPEVTEPTTEPEVDPDLPKPVENKVTVSIADYATANGWQNETKYLSILADQNITITAATPNNGAYTGKYFSNNKEWRIYQTDGGSITITAADGKTIVSVKITYNIGNYGFLVKDGVKVASNEVVSVNGNSVIFGVSNNNTDTTKTNGQVKITAIEIIYLGEAEAPSCQHTGAEAVRENEVGATCTTDGSYESVVYCSKCGDELSRENVTVQMKGHMPADAVVENEVDATCTAEGSYDLVVKCSECGTEISRESKTVGKLDHVPADAVTENKVDATCTAEGSYDLVVKCSECGYEMSRETKKVGKADHTLSDWNVVKDSTCKEKGTKTRECTVCDYSETVDIPTKNHNYNSNDICVDCGSVNDGHQHTYQSVVTPSTCTTEGYTTHTCACGDSYVDSKVPAAHTPAAAVKENEVGATCSKEGSYDLVVYCSKCGHEISRETKTVGKLAHTPAEAIKENEVDATCSQEGSYDSVVKCSKCGEELSRESQTVGKLAHTPAEAIKENEVDATCSQEGSYDSVVKCSKCGEEISRESQTVGKLAHTPADAVVENKVDATCTTEGSYDNVVYCTVCTEVVSKENVTVKALGHDFYYGDCTRCEQDYVPATTEEIVFDFGANISTTAHKDGKDIGTGKSYPLGNYTLEITDATKTFAEEYDAKGNSCLKLGSSSVIGGFSFTVPDEVTEVIIYAAKYKAKTSKLVINGKTYTLSGSSDNGAYDEIIVDTSATKTVTVATVSGSTRAMINTIVFVIQKGDVHECEEHSDNKATCSAPARCLVCGENVGKTLDHTPAEAEVENKVDATCTTDGSYDSVVKCSVCGGEISRETITVEAKGHTNGAPVVENTVKPDCTTEGSYENVVYCTVCGGEVSRETITVEANGHTNGAPVVENTVEPDCTNEGSYENVVYCTACGGEVSRETVTVKANGHTNGTPVVENTVEPDCTTEGSYENVVYCTVCGGEVSRETVTVKANGHDLVEYDAKVPTCTEIGWDSYVKCNNCQYTTYAPLPMAEHNYVNGKCSACNKIEDGHEHVFENDVTIITPATCTTDGTATAKCLCGNVGEIIIKAPGHTPVVDAAVAPKCEEAGLTEGSHCSTCGDVLVAQEEVEATGHATTKVYTVIEGVLYYAATCGCEDQREAVEAGTIVKVANEADLKTVLYAGYGIELTANIELTSAIEIVNQTVTINLSDYTLTSAWIDEEGVVEVLWVRGENANVTINGNGAMISGKGSGTNSVVSATEGATVTINGGRFYSEAYGAVIYASTNGTVNIYGGEFEAASAWDKDGKWYVLDIDESAETLGTINVYGGTFVKYNPANNNNDGTAYANKLAENRHSIYNAETQTYTVGEHTPGTAVEENVNEATCSQEGSYESVIYCSACRAELSRETKTLEKADHTPAEAVKENEIPATCTTAGSYNSVVYCSECNYEISRTAQTIEKHPHSEVTHDAQAATCVAAGWEAFVTCENCDYTTYKEIPATGKHTYSYGKCSVCQADFVFVSVTDEITFELGDDGVANKENTTALTSNTSFKVGNYTLTITNLTKVYDKCTDGLGNSCLKLGSSSAVGGFSFTVPDDVTSVVIYVAKYKANTTKISVNGKEYTISGSSNNGTYDAITVDTTATKTVTLTTVSGGVRAMVNTIVFVVETKHVCESDNLADCTNAARCLVCGDPVGTAKGHIYENETITTAATCTTDGVKTLTCVCGDTKTEVIPATGHNHDNEAVTTEATCTTDGVKTLTCACGDIITEVIPATGHIFVEGKCECGAEDENGTTTVIFNVPDGVESVVMGEGNVLPSAGAPTGYTFAGWSEEELDETTTKPTILEAGSVYNGAATVLYAVYTRTETTAGTSQFVKVTSTPTDWSGQYLIVYEAGKVAFNGALTTLDAASNTVSVSITNNTIQATDTLIKSVFTISKSGSNYTIKSASGYYIGNTADSNKLNSSTSTKYTNTISLNNDGSVQIVGSGGSILRYNANSGQYRFRYFKSSTYTSQKAICLYQLVETEGTTTTYYATL